MINITNSELKIMKIVWEHESVSSLQIIDELESEWSKNTIRTFIKRLYNKKIISISKTIGKTNYYYSNINEEEYKYIVLNKILNELFDGNIENVNKIYEKYNK